MKKVRVQVSGKIGDRDFGEAGFIDMVEIRQAKGDPRYARRNG
jgi:hypothetical protein